MTKKTLVGSTSIRKILIIFLFSGSFFSLKSQVVTHHNPVFQATIQKPSSGVSYQDPKFNSIVKRITNARNQGYAGLFPDYSKRQAWNSDESLMMIRAGGGEVLIYNAISYQFIKTLSGNFTGLQDIFWHPANPQLIYFFADNTFNSFNVNNELVTPLKTFSNYIYVTTRAEGNMSNDARYVALVGYDSNWNMDDFFVFDVLTNSVISTLPVAGTNAENLDWLSISPLGNYVIADYADNVTGQFHGVEVYDKQFNPIWQKLLGAGHSDYGIDTNGKEILIMDYYDPNDNITYIKKFALEDGYETTLLGLSPLFDMHESCRSTSGNGWVYVSTFDYVGRLTDDSLSWLPFEDEIFALKTDGSGAVLRIAHHHSRRFSPITPDSDNSVYFAEPHATANRNGTKILFGSNWRMDMATDSAIDAYVADISNLLSSNSDYYTAGTSLKVYPNPIINQGFVEFTVPASDSESDVLLDLYDLTGRKVKTLFEKKLSPAKYYISFNINGINEGYYFLQYNTSDKVQHSKIEIIR